jgi:hypothetical protein
VRIPLNLEFLENMKGEKFFDFAMAGHRLRDLSASSDRKLGN